MEFIVPEPFYDQKPFLIIGRKIVSEMETSKKSRFGSPYMIFQHKLLQSTQQKKCGSPAVTVPMARMVKNDPKRTKSILPHGGFSFVQLPKTPPSLKANPPRLRKLMLWSQKIGVVDMDSKKRWMSAAIWSFFGDTVWTNGVDFGVGLDVGGTQGG